MTLNKADVLPLYKQLTDILRGDIEKGKFKKGEKIPTEIELSRLYNVSRITVRNALEELAKENLLIRKQGKGTFINNEKFSRGISGSKSFTEMCREIGRKPGAKVIKCVIEDANEKDTEVLKLEPNSKIIVIERIRYADGIPVAFEISRLPQRFTFLLDEDLNDSSMFTILAEKYGIVFMNSRKTIELVYATYEMSRYLNISLGYPLLSISGVSTDKEGVPSHRSMQFIVADKFKFTV
ncbi:GntR family transcriptional regulator [Bacillus sp. FJAT-29814]|uniref:GntR family transcriptional regulator n=1 Tax=Bacillus sp. FJAT-29814 TaxID=1729688 RepID=UPI0008302D62|nr:GntR family transcriptional regulator [Bacillus sp. FJAT-29814]